MGDCSERRFDGEIFCGAGARSLLAVRTLHDRLDHGISCLSAIQQEGLQGSEFDPATVEQLRAEIDEVVFDIAAALGKGSESTGDDHDDVLVADMIDAMVENERDDGFTRAEIRDLMARHFDREYDADVRHLAPVPTQAEVDAAVQVLLMDERDGRRCCREEDGRIYLVHDDLEERRMEKAILADLRGETE